MKISRWKKYDKDSGLWIASIKRIYFYWFRFLQHAETDSNRQVDWSRYEGWGGRDYILRTTQYEWWNKNWKTLFGYKEGEKEKILYPLSKVPTGEPTRPQPEGIRLALRVYELKVKPLLNGNDLTDEDNESDGKKGDAWEIAKYIARTEYAKRRDRGKIDPSYDPDDWMFHIARRDVAKKLRKEDPVEFRKQKRILQSRVGRYMRAAEKHLDNVCKGQFP